MIQGVILRIPANQQIKNLQSIINQPLIYFYCNDILDEYIIKGPIDSELIRSIKNTTEYQDAELMNEDGKICYLINRCNADDPNHLTSIKTQLYSNQFFLVSYIQQLSNWQYIRTITFSEDNISKLQESISEEQTLEILEIKSLPGLNVSSVEPYIEIKDLVTNLTETQYEILINAIEAGYYNIPRQVTIPELANKRGISRSAVQKSFRKAENKIIASVIKSLYEYFARTASE